MLGVTGEGRKLAGTMLQSFASKASSQEPPALLLAGNEDLFLASLWKDAWSMGANGGDIGRDWVTTTVGCPMRCPGQTAVLTLDRGNSGFESGPCIVGEAGAGEEEEETAAKWEKQIWKNEYKEGGGGMAGCGCGHGETGRFDSRWMNASLYLVATRCKKE